jgi:hypothetical protein
MSDYSHEKVVRLLFPVELLQECNTKDPHECIKLLKERLGDLWNDYDKYHFKLGYGSQDYYIDWLYYSTYGEESGDWGSVRLLTFSELNAIKPYFDKIGVNYTDNDLRLVDYCYYNCCEPPDYYEVACDENDDSELFFDN